MSCRLQLIDDLSYEDVKKCYRGSVSPSFTQITTPLSPCGRVLCVCLGGENNARDHEEVAAAPIRMLSQSLLIRLQLQDDDLSWCHAAATAVSIVLVFVVADRKRKAGSGHVAIDTVQVCEERAVFTWCNVCPVDQEPNKQERRRSDCSQLCRRKCSDLLFSVISSPAGSSTTL